VYCPCKKTELLLTGLDESITESEVWEVVAAARGCIPESIKFEELKNTSATVSLSAASACSGKQNCADEKLLVEWIQARILLLNVWPQVYKLKSAVF